MALSLRANGHVLAILRVDESWNYVPFSRLEKLDSANAGGVLEFEDADGFFGGTQALPKADYDPTQHDLIDDLVVEGDVIIPNFELLHLPGCERHHRSV